MGSILFDKCVKFGFESCYRTQSTSHARYLVCLVDNTVKKRRYEEDTLLGTPFQKLLLDEDLKKRLRAKRPKQVQIDEVVQMDTVVIEPLIRHPEPVTNTVSVKLVTAARSALFCSRKSWLYEARIDATFI